jgi:hypothetical protein
VNRPASRAQRILFLDDASDRAAAFLAAHPDAVWVRTAEQCVERLDQSWDEVHLDHDLGGEVFVDHDRADCGMEVVRWLCDAPRMHLRKTRFIIHSHNANAACIMVLHLEQMGLEVQSRPFGKDTEKRTSGALSLWAGHLFRWLSRALGLVRSAKQKPQLSEGRIMEFGP